MKLTFLFQMYSESEKRPESPVAMETEPSTGPSVTAGAAYGESMIFFFFLGGGGGLLLLMFLSGSQRIRQEWRDFSYT